MLNLPQHYEASASPPVEAGVNTAAPVAAPDTPATDGGKTTAPARKASDGDGTSRRSAAKKSTSSGKQPAPPSGPTLAEALPYALAISAVFLYQHQGAAEITAVLNSPLRLKTSTHELDLDPGDYLIVRWPGSHMGYDVQAIERPALPEVHMSTDIQEVQQ
jgi:hypothetical protein